MKATYIDYKDTHSFSHTLLSYLNRDPLLESFVADWPDLAAFGRQMKRKSLQESPVNREVLIRVLQQQYSRLPDFASEKSQPVRSNIQSLADSDTYTITTGHQLNIFTGPLYFIFKIITAIRLAQDLKAAYPDRHFVPVYWMATEDHDFDEINHTWIHGRKISWDVPGVSATGRMRTESIVEVLRTYQGLLGLSGNSGELSQLVEAAYLGHDNLADATRQLVHSLFAGYGLVIVDADDASLKSTYMPIVRADVLQQHSHRAIQNTNGELISRGFSVQVTDRPINFFYLTDDFRERIVFENDRYEVLHQNIRFTEEELETEMQVHPERFSPNVVMRPLYQEVILPNLAYIGGGAEIVYWLQLKGVFDHYHIPFPLLIPRNSAMMTTGAIAEKLLRLDLDFPQIFQSAQDVKTHYVKTHTSHQLDLRDEWTALNAIFEKIKLRAYKIDPTLGPSTDAVRARLKKAIDRLEKKLLKADKKNYQDALQQIDRIKEKLFPNGGLQERSENFTVLYVKHGQALFEELIRHFHPLDFKFTILY